MVAGILAIGCLALRIAYPEETRPGNGIGETIDPTIEDNWLRDHFESRPYVEEGRREPSCNRLTA